MITKFDHSLIYAKKEKKEALVIWFGGMFPMLIGVIRKQEADKLCQYNLYKFNYVC